MADATEKVVGERETMAAALEMASRRAEQWLEARAAGAQQTAADLGAHLAEDIRTFRRAERRLRRAEKKLR